MHSLTSDLRPPTSCFRIGERASPDEPRRPFLELRERHHADVATGAFAHGDLALFHLAVAADEHERNLLQLRVAYLRADLVAARVDLDAQARLAQVSRDLFGVIVHAVGDRQHRDLHRREPHRKRARLLLDEDAEEALNRAEQRAVNHHGAVRLVVLADVLKLEALRQVEVPLHGAELPQATDGVLDLEVNLRPVERGLALDALVIDAALVESLGQRRLGVRPALFRAEPLLRGVAAFDRKLEADFVEAEGSEHVNDKINAVADLLANLLRRAEQVRVVNGEAAHAHQPVERARKLRAIDRAHLGVALRQVAVRALLRAVDADVERAVHRLDAELHVFELHRREHRVAVRLVVAARDPEVALGDVRRVNKSVAALVQLLVEVVLHRLADDRALRVPEDEASAVLLLNREEVEFFAQATVVAPLGLLALLDPGVEFFLRGEGGSVDAQIG